MAGSFSGSDFGGTATAEPSVTTETSAAPETSVETTPTETAPVTPEVSTTTVVDAPKVEAAPVKKRGAIPTPEHEQVVKNTRDKTRAEVEQEWQPYAWAKTVDETTFKQTQQWRDFAKRDPVGFLESAIADAEANPQLAPQIKSLAARLLGKRGAAQVDAAFDEEPGPDIPTDTSNGVPVVFSVTQQRKREAWLMRQMETKFAAQLAPVLKETAATGEERRQYQALVDANGFAQSEYGKAAKWPGFEQHKAQIATRLNAMQLTSDDPREVALALRDAYLEVVGPTFGTTAHANAIRDVSRKVAASSVNPSTTLTAPGKDASRMSFRELLSAEFAKQ